jgi:hypothetical protein
LKGTGFSPYIEYNAMYRGFSPRGNMPPDEVNSIP